MSETQQNTLPDKWGPEKEEPSLQSWYLASRHRFVGKLARRFCGMNVTRVLDAGCGSGGVTAALTREGFTVTSCDLSAAAVEWGKQKGRLRDAIVADVCRLPFDDRAFDAVVSSEVLEHVPDDAAALRGYLRVSRGPVVITVPAHMYLWSDSDILLHHRLRYSRAEVEALAARAGARVIALHAFGFMPAAFLLLYHMIRKPGRGSHDAPLASRFQMPRWFDRVMFAISNAELWLAVRGLMPWGHAWWAVLENGAGTDRTGGHSAAA